MAAAVPIVMSIVGGLINNAAILLALTLAYSLLIAHLPREQISTRLLGGALFGLVAVLGMTYPATLEPGVFFDARTVVVAMAGLFGGIPAAAVSAVMTAGYRFWLGGPGTAMGVGTVLTAALAGIAFHALRRAGVVKITLLNLGLFGLAVHLLGLAWVFTLDSGLRAEVLEQAALPFLLVLPATSVLLGLLLHNQDQRIDDEQALRDNRDRLLEARRIAGLGDWEWDLRTDTHSWSEETFALFGRDPKLPPVPYPETQCYFAPESWAGLVAVIDRARGVGEAFTYDAELQPADGSPRWVMVRGRAIRDTSGQITMLRGTIQDVTERKAASEALAREQTFLSTLINTIPDLVWLKDPDGVYLACNPRFERMYGASAEEIKGHTDRDFVSDETAAFFRQHDLNALAADGPTVNEEILTFASDGHQEHVETIKTPMRDADGHLVGVLGIARDITPQREAQEALRRERDRMHQLRRRIETIAAHVPGFVYQFQQWPDGRSAFPFASGGMAELLGIDPMAFAEDAAGALALIHPDDKERVMDSIAESMRTLDPWLEAFRVRLSGDRLIWLEGESSPEQQPDGSVIWYGHCRDITERMRLESALREREFFFRESQAAARIGSYIADFPADRWESSDVLDDIFGIDTQYHRSVQGWLDLVHPDDRERMRQHLQDEVLRKGEPFDQVYRIVRKADGTTRWVLGLGRVEKDNQGRVLTLRGTIQDITDRKRAELEALNTRANLEAALASMSDAVSISDAEGNLVQINEAFAIFHRFSSVAECPNDLSAYPDILEVCFLDGSPAPLSEWAIPRALRGETAEHQEYRLRRKDTGEAWIGSYNSAPIFGADGNVIGAVVTGRDVTKAKEQQAELARIAHHDPLTGLPNRRLLTDRLDQAIASADRSGRSLALCYLDLDGFKALNDTYGHEAGDQFLIKVAETLPRVVRAHDSVARLGGDEFVLLLTELRRPEDCSELIDRVLSTIRRRITLPGISHQISASIGVTVYPCDRSDSDTLLRHADQAMYRAKELGKNLSHLYDPQQDRALKASRLMRDEIIRAVEEDEFVLFFQPQVDLISREVIGAEALIRWQHPTKGLLPPSAFLPEIEGSPLDIAVGDWVIEAALCQMDAWRQQNMRLPVAVNISAGHLMAPGFVERLKERFGAHPHVTPAEMELEMLESTAFSDFEQARQVLTDCRNLGVRIALDDFGTGYSSLAYFRSLPVDLLKIDQCFVRDMLEDQGDMEIVESVVRLSQAFHRTVIAEGIETLEHAALLTWLGCRRGQGFGIARPMPAEELGDWVANWSAQPGWPSADDTQGRDDVQLMVAGRSHRHWVHLIVRVLEGQDVPDAAEMAATNCAFSRWYGGRGAANCGQFREYQAIGALHDRIHALADTLLLQARSGQSEAACERLPELYAARDLLLEKLAELSRRLRPERANDY